MKYFTFPTFYRLHIFHFYLFTSCRNPIGSHLQHEPMFFSFLKQQAYLYYVRNSY